MTPDFRVEIKQLKAEKAILVRTLKNILRQADKNRDKYYGGRRGPKAQAAYDKCVAALKSAGALT